MNYNEQAREEKENENHIINVQIAGIALFIPIFFVLLLLMSRVRIHHRILDFMSLLSLLLLFEFITLMSEHKVETLSNHQPVWELLFLITMASILAPLHHKFTHLLKTHILGRHKINYPSKNKLPILQKNINMENNTQSNQQNRDSREDVSQETNQQDLNQKSNDGEGNLALNDDENGTGQNIIKPNPPVDEQS